MICKIPIVGSPVSFNDIAFALARTHNKPALSEFSLAMSGFTGKKHVYFTDSGLSSFYIILKALKEKLKRKEVIIPAYTAGSLVVGILKAGLKPVLCDVSLDDFNLDPESMLNALSPDTLAAVCVHMFGVGLSGIEQLKERMPKDVFLIEDCAQSMGSKIVEKQAGCFGDISFFSFNRGKNLPTYKGGCIALDSAELAGYIEKEMFTLRKQNIFFKFSLPFKISAISLVTRSLIYGLSYPFVSLFKDISVPKDITVKEFSGFQANLGIALLNKSDVLFEKRNKNGMFLIDKLKQVEGITVPLIPAGSTPVFNRFPLVFKDLNKKEETEKKLWDAGIETSRMYFKPLHHMFDLGYKREDFPNAVYLAGHLLTLPVHPLLGQKDLLKIIGIIIETVRN